MMVQSPRVYNDIYLFVPFDIFQLLLTTSDQACDDVHKEIERLNQYVDDAEREITSHTLLQSDDNARQTVYAKKRLIEMQKLLKKMKFQSYERTGQ